MRAAVIGINGLTLDATEAALIRAAQPAGVILFARNIADPAQLRALMAQLRDALPLGAVLMVDQEGGRVARMRPPHWRAHPPLRRIGLLAEADPASGQRAAFLTGALIGLQCREAGFDVVCAPVLDRALPGMDAIVGDRAFGADPQLIVNLGRHLADGLLAAGIQPVGKHAPGHGHAGCDSHLELPRVAAQPDDDLAPFIALADLPWMMTAHILFEQWDRERPGTLSEIVVRGVIRARIGAQGLIVSDDLAMQALSGPPAARALAALAAGCDVALYCPGDAAGNQAVLQAVPPLTAPAAALLARAHDLAASRRQNMDQAALAAERDRLLA